MSQFNFIKHLLGIKDPNIDILGTHYEKIRSGTIYKAYKIIQNGTLTTYPRLPKGVNGVDTRLELKKPRFLCKECNTTFQLGTSLIEANKSISNPLKFNIFYDATKKKSEVDIAFDNNVSHSTVNRVINDIG